MSKDGYLPDDVTESMIPGNRPGDQHDSRCPQHEDSPELCECGHPVDAPTHVNGVCSVRLKTGAVCVCVDATPTTIDCKCADLAEIDVSEQAEARYEASRERGL